MRPLRQQPNNKFIFGSEPLNERSLMKGNDGYDDGEKSRT